MNRPAKKIFSLLGVGLFSTWILARLRGEFRFRSSHGKVVVINGGSRGLGLLIAQCYAQKGASVALFARDEAELKRAKNIIQFDSPESWVQYYVCDSKQREQVEKCIAQVIQDFGQIDIVVNNAGVISTAPIENTTETDFTDSISTHFWGPYYMIETALPHLQAGCRIVNIASIGGLVPFPHLSAYCAGKHALVGYSRTLRAELAARKIYVTTVSPSVMRTGSIDHANFKGQVKKEYAWFSVLSSMPFLSKNADKVARKIVQASEYGKAEVLVSLSTRIAAALQGYFPNVFADLMFLANSFLPTPLDGKMSAVEGKDAHSRISPSILTRSSQNAAERNNEGPIV
ncbi:SDR family NAD(P)-dependent oxidoreductase [Bdellovibrio sp. HCB2-146]|uniref:SDR family NAD(P)-dependent oxidoreductase n=1 Tax=Bdellovibrio sp. HCB2-146 TaxID=3394362 RepID=UPI0039BD251C